MGGEGSKLKSHELLIETRTDHDMAINCMSVSEDGSLIATGSDDKTVRMWATTDMETECLGILKGHTSYITSVKIYDAFVITGSADGSVRKWDATTCDCLIVYEGHSSRVLRVITDGIFIFSASSDSQAKAWLFDDPEYDEESGEGVEDLRTFEGHKLSITSLIYIPGNENAECMHENGVEINTDDVLITGSADATARSWSIATGKTIRIFRGHTGPIACMEINEDATTLYTGSSDTTIGVWNINKGTLIKKLLNHTAAVVCLHLRNKLLFSGSSDNTAKCWVNHFDVPASFTGHLHTIITVIYKDGYLFTASGDATARVYDAKTRALKAVFKGHTSAITCMCILGEHLYTGSSDCTLRVWDIRKSRLEVDMLLDLEDESSDDSDKQVENPKKFDEYKRKSVDESSKPDPVRPPSPSCQSRLSVPSPTPSRRSRLSASPSPSAGRSRLSPSPSRLMSQADKSPPRTIEDLDL